ncbi:MAG: transporter, partial [Candidatus Methylumidiphilus sp.]
IANPGPDLANFPNSAFTLPRGRAYIEISPFTYYGSGFASPAQYNAEFLMRYGLTDDIELRLFGNGLSWVGGSEPTWGFSPIAFDTKIQLWTEKPDWFLPAAGFEAYLQTEWLGNKAFNGGTQPSFTFNFDQSLPWEVDFEYNLGATRFQDSIGQNIWEFSFQWAFQRDLFNKDIAVFIHGFYNAASLPRLPNANLPYDAYKAPTQSATGAGLIWTANKRFAVYGQVSGGMTKFTPSIISLLGFALSF